MISISSFARASGSPAAYRRATLAVITVLTCAAVHAEPLKVYAAGSLVAPLKELIAASGLPADAVAAPTFGPAGLLSKRLEGGETADLFLSADLAAPRRLMAASKAVSVLPFARNALCLLSKRSLGSDDRTVVDNLVDPGLRLATSTPVSDPGGDYAFAIFDKADVVRPGSGQVLKAKALQLIGSPNAMVPVAGKTASASVFIAEKADALIYYCSGQEDTLRDVPGLVSKPLPKGLDVTAVYGMALLGDKPEAYKLALFILSDSGQAILMKHGLMPVLSPN